jgi:hypothetical protein
MLVAVALPREPVVVIVKSPAGKAPRLAHAPENVRGAIDTFAPDWVTVVVVGQVTEVPREG